MQSPRRSCNIAQRGSRLCRLERYDKSRLNEQDAQVAIALLAYPAEDGLRFGNQDENSLSNSDCICLGTGEELRPHGC
jgi:hypothetical protein